MDPAHELATLVATGSPPLDRSLALIAAAGRPIVDVDRVLGRLDELARAVPGDDVVSLCADVFGGADGVLGKLEGGLQMVCVHVDIVIENACVSPSKYTLLCFVPSNISTKKALREQDLFKHEATKII